MSAREPFLGVLSDTHGLVRPEALEALAGAERILHAGDVGKPEVLDQLAEIAPVVAVRGNVDQGPWAAELPERATATWRGLTCLVVHRRVDVGEPADDVDLVVCGHSHKPGLDEDGGALWLNPGSAGPRRFKLPVTLARVFAPKRVELVHLLHDGAPSATLAP